MAVNMAPAALLRPQRWPPEDAGPLDSLECLIMRKAGVHVRASETTAPAAQACAELTARSRQAPSVKVSKSLFDVAADYCVCKADKRGGGGVARPR